MLYLVSTEVKNTFIYVSEDNKAVKIEETYYRDLNFFKLVNLEIERVVLYKKEDNR